MARNFREMLERQWDRGNFVCVGLDPDNSKLPEPWRYRHTEYSTTTFESQVSGFLLDIVRHTRDLVCAYKPNTAFFEAAGERGWKTLHHVVRQIREIAPDVPVILDAKRGDIGNTNAGYVEAIFDDLGADAITVHPYLGSEAMMPFLERKDKGIFVLCRTSNPGAGELQDPEVKITEEMFNALFQGFPVDERTHYVPKAMPYYQYVAWRVSSSRGWNKYRNCGLVVGATCSEELAHVRQIVAEVRQVVGDIPILIPGIGAQGGDLEKTVKAGKDSRGRGMIINSSRGIIYASSGADFAEAARRETGKLRDRINQYREAPVSA